MLAQAADGVGAPPAPALGHAFSDHSDGPVQPDTQGVGRAFQFMIAAFTLHIGAEATNAGKYRFSGLWMLPDQTR